MPTTGKINSTLMTVYLGGTKINHSTDASISFNHATRDVTSKDSGGYTERLEGLRDWNASGTFWFAFDATYGAEDIDDLYTGRTTVTLRFSTEVTGDTYYEGTAYLESYEVSSPSQEETVSYTCTWAGTGSITIGSVS